MMNMVTTERTIIETRIAYHMTAAVNNLLAVGACLNEAKEKNIVPHGEWEAWVEAHTGMSCRTAQRYMQAAAEIPETSIAAKLPISKIGEILRLPEPEREQVAQRAYDESMTVKQLRAEVARLTRDVEVEREKNDAAGEDQAELIAARGEIDRYGRMIVDLQRENADLRGRKPEGISEEAQRQIDSLTADVEASNEYAAEQARLRQEAQKELLDLRMAKSTADADQSDSIEDCIEDIRDFLGAVTWVMHSKAIGREDRRYDKLLEHVRMVKRWAEEAESKLTADVVYVEM